MKKELLELLQPKNVEIREIDIMTVIMKNLLDTIGTSSPNTKEVTDELSSKMFYDIGMLRRLEFNVNTYFTGNGPIALQLKKYVALESLLYGVNGYTELSTTIDEFNFNPTDTKEIVHDLNTFLSNVRGYCLDAPLNTLRDPLPDNIVLKEVETGLYADNIVEDSFVIVLHTQPTTVDGLQTIFISRPNCDAYLWYWHPFEQAWINSDHTNTFEGVLEQLHQELAKALIEATCSAEQFNFNEELEGIVKLSSSIFNDEHYLDSSIVSIEQNQGALPSGYYKYDEERSEIKISIKESQFVLRNTKGFYPSLTSSLVRVVNGTSSTLEISKVDNLFQRQLIKKTKSLFTILLKDIDNKKTKETGNDAVH